MTARQLCLLVTLAAACPADTEGKDSTDVGTPNSSPDGGPDGGNGGPSVRGDQVYTFALLSTDGELAVSDFEGEYDETSCSTSCDTNSAPSLGEPVFVVNGTASNTLVATTSDDITIFVPFADADCNLSCGMRSDSFQDPQGGGDAAASLPSNLPCSTQESDVYLRVTPASLPLDAGDYRYTLWVEDTCGERSSTETIEFGLQ